MTIIVMSILFLFANGDLGRYKLTNIGVSVSKSIRALGHLTLYGFGFSWLIVLLACAIIVGVRILSTKIFEEYSEIKQYTSSAYANDKSESTSTSTSKTKSDSASTSTSFLKKQPLLESKIETRRPRSVSSKANKK